MYIQNMVYVAVKLKTRLLQPSITLPFGWCSSLKNYTAYFLQGPTWLKGKGSR